MEEKLSDDVIEQIKDFIHRKLTEKQKLLIDKLILNVELKERYKKHGLCKECKQPYTGSSWCQLCNAKYFQQNFKNWTSGNHDVDEFIQNTQLKSKNYKDFLEWIEYDRFKNVEYLAKGGFGTTYKGFWKDGPINYWDSDNNQWKRFKEDEKGYPVALKCLHDSQDITAEFLREVGSHLIMNNDKCVVTCYGITKDSGTNNFMMVMRYAHRGSLRKYLNDNFNSLDWKIKLRNLYTIAAGLCNIHSHGLIHHDFHCGNILSVFNDEVMITDLGLCQPVKAKSSQGDNDKQIYGVLPYVAPEVLRGKEYTQASDIYGFGCITYEVCTGLPPYHDMAHEEFLAIKICQGLRPKSNYKIPQLILDIITKCWDSDPLKRPKAEELQKLTWDLYMDANYKENSTISKQIKETDKINKKLSLTKSSSPSSGMISYATHSQAVYTSRLLNYKNLPEPKNADYNVTGYSESIRMDFSKLNFGFKSKDD